MESRGGGAVNGSQQTGNLHDGRTNISGWLVWGIAARGRATTSLKLLQVLSLCSWQLALPSWHPNNPFEQKYVFQSPRDGQGQKFVSRIRKTLNLFLKSVLLQFLTKQWKCKHQHLDMFWSPKFPTSLLGNAQILINVSPTNVYLMILNLKRMKSNGRMSRGRAHLNWLILPCKW